MTVVTNLIPWGSFESSSSGWSVNGGSAAPSTEQAQTGLKSQKHTSTASGYQGIQRNFVVTGAPIPLRTDTFSIWVYAPAAIVGRSALIQINEVGGAFGSQAFALTYVTLAAGWQRISCTGTLIRADRTEIYVIARVEYSASGQVAYWDNAQYVSGSVIYQDIETDGVAITAELYTGSGGGTTGGAADAALVAAVTGSGGGAAGGSAVAALDSTPAVTTMGEYAPTITTGGSP